MIRYRWEPQVLTSALTQLYETKTLDEFLVLSALAGGVLYVTNESLLSTLTVDVRNGLLAELVRQFLAPFSAERTIPAILLEMIPPHHEGLCNSNLLTAIHKLLDQRADPNSLPIDLDGHGKKQAQLNKSRHSSSQQHLRKRLTTWEYCALQILALCNPEHDIMSDSRQEYAPNRAIQLFQLCTVLLSKEARLSVFTRAFPPPLKHRVLRACNIDQLPLSVGTVLERLRMASLGPKHRIFVTSTREGDKQRVEAAYREALWVYRRRKLSGRVLLELENLWSWIVQFFHSAAFQSFYTFVSGGLVFLVISRWLA